MEQSAKILRQMVMAFALLSIALSCGTESFSPDGGNPSTGTGGSLARFTIDCDHLYAVDESSLKVINVTDAKNPQFISSIDLGVGIETIFPYEEYLYIGSSTGMHIYNLQNCTQPQFESRYEHIFGCDPVVVNENTAYVTIRNGSSCGTRTNANLLEIIDVSDKARPFLLASHSVDEPWGLGIDKDTLFLCHGSRGFGIYDVKDPSRLTELFKFPQIKSYDVIPQEKRLMIIAEDGLYQYDYSLPGSPTLLSKIPINN